LQQRLESATVEHDLTADFSVLTTLSSVFQSNSCKGHNRSGYRSVVKNMVFYPAKS